MDKFLIIGNGNSAKREKDIIKKILPNIEVKVLLTSNKHANDSDNIHEYLFCIDDAIKFNPQAVFIATPNSTHIAFANIFLNKADYILIDKPLDSNFNDCDLFYYKALKSKTKIFINFQRRFSSCWKALKKHLSTDKTGNFMYGSVIVNSNVESWENYSNNFYAVNSNLGGGVLTTECHEFDLISWLFKKQLHVKNCKCNIIDGVEYNSLIFACLVDKDQEKPINFILDFNSKIVQRKLTLVFSNITYEVDEINSTIKITKGSQQTVEKYKKNNPYKELLNCIITNKFDNVPTIVDGIEVNNIIRQAKYYSGNLLNNNYINPINIKPMETIKYIVERIVKEIDSFISIYGMGSVGYGGFVEGWSDLDIDVILREEQNDINSVKKIINSIENDAKNIYERIDIRVYKLSDLNLSSSNIEHGVCSRKIMIKDSAVLLAGTDIKSKVEIPSKTEIIDESIFLLRNIIKIININTDWDDIAAYFALIARVLFTIEKECIIDKKTAIEFMFNNKKNILNSEELIWMTWAYNCRINNNLYLFHDELKEKATKILNKLITKIINYIMEVYNYDNA